MENGKEVWKRGTSGGLGEQTLSKTQYVLYIEVYSTAGESKCNASILRSHWTDGLKTWRETAKSEQQTNIRSDPSYV